MESPGREEDARNLEELKSNLAHPTKWLLEQKTLFTFLTQLKVLSRKERHRKAVGEKAIADLLRHIGDQATGSKIQAEGANVILNICYERENVNSVLKCGGAATLVEFLTSKDEELQANAAGALQSICFQPEGRKVVRGLGAIPPLVELLSADSMNHHGVTVQLLETERVSDMIQEMEPLTIQVKARAVGALHNMSSDVDAIRVIRRKGGIKWLIRLLRSNQPCVCGSAAGALQNVSREVASRILIRDSDAVTSLIHLLTSSEVQTQICAAGALLNVLGPELSDENNPTPASEKRRQAFVRTITLTLVASIVKQTVFNKEAKRILSTETSNSTPTIPKTSAPMRPIMSASGIPFVARKSSNSSSSTASTPSSQGKHSNSPVPKNQSPTFQGFIPPHRRYASPILIQDSAGMVRRPSVPTMPNVD